MNATTISPTWADGRPQPPSLRLLRNGDDALAEPLREREGPALQLASDMDRSSRVLIAGADSARRATLRKELARTLGRNTRFEQASATWEVLEHAPVSRMVILSGDLDDAPADALMQMLGHRHPSLPVISVEEPTTLAYARAT